MGEVISQTGVIKGPKVPPQARRRTARVGRAAGNVKTAATVDNREKNPILARFQNSQPAWPETGASAAAGSRKEVSACREYV